MGYWTRRQLIPANDVKSFMNRQKNGVDHAEEVRVASG